MNSDHSRDRKIIIIICVAIILLTAGGVFIGLTLLSKDKDQSIIVETEAEKAARQAKKMEVDNLTSQLQDQNLTAEARAKILKQLESLR